MSSAQERFESSVSGCLNSSQQALLGSLSVDMEASKRIQEITMTQSENDLWHSLRKRRITASLFGRIAQRQSCFESLVGQLNSSRFVQTVAMRHGVELEPHTAMIYANKAKGEKVHIFPSGLVIHPKCPWLGCSPDRKVYDLEETNTGQNPFGLLEIKVKKEGQTTFDNVQYLAKDRATGLYSLKKKRLILLSNSVSTWSNWP